MNARWALRVGLGAALLVNLSAPVRAHGETMKPELKQVTLCTAPSSVQVVFEAMVSARQRSVQPRLERTLRATLASSLKKSGVRQRSQGSCAKSDAGVVLVAHIRYLNPNNYVGFGDPAYSYNLSLAVARPGTAGPRFVAGRSDIHSEAKTGRSFESEVSLWGAELLDDLAIAWRTANPGTP